MHTQTKQYRRTQLDIRTLDLNFQNIPDVIAAYLIVGSAGPVLVETGPVSTIEPLKAQLAAHGYTPADIHHVLVTHIHLDHAGAAGWWARQGAQVHVHHAGAPHLIDPSRLLSSAQRIYGAMMDELWGKTSPAPAENVRALYDGDTIEVGEIRLTALDTPGHAAHHLVFLMDHVAFAGDAAGVRLPGSTFISLPAPPPEFDLEAWQETIKRLLDHNLTTLYLTHFGPVEDAREHLERLARLGTEAAEFVRDRMQAGVERDALVGQYYDQECDRAQAHGLSKRDFEQYQIANPAFMSVDGMMRYWRKRG